MTRHPRPPALAGLLSAAAALLLGACDGPSPITAPDLKGYVSTLASDAFAGRETGGPGIAEAERYIAAQFARDGLKPLPGRSDFFVNFMLFRHTYDPAQTRLVFSRGEEQIPAVIGAGFRPFWFSSTGSASAPVVFAGYGITAPEFGWDDYQGLDVAGKVVLVLRHEPPPQGERNNGSVSRFGGKEYSRHAFFATKARNALAHGAAGMILFTDPASHHTGVEDLRVQGSLSLDREHRGQGGGESIGLLAAQISQDLAARLLQPVGLSPEGLQAGLDEGTKAREIGLGGLAVSMGVGASNAAAQEVPARDVAAYLQGSDPRVAGQWIVIGGHHDHLGSIPTTSGDGIYNGADDNASGTAAVLELARRFASMRPRPARSLVFMTFSGEEEGLFGSQVLFAQKLVPRENIHFMINLDMIGRNPDKPVMVNGQGVDEQLRAEMEATAEALALKWGYSGSAPTPANSDYGPFMEAGIPFLSYFTGEHPDYHEVTDEAPKLAYGRMEQLVRWVSETVQMIAAP